MVDISDQFSQATSTPAEAADNILAANVYGTQPTNDKSMAPLVPAAKNMIQPSEAVEPVADYAGTSDEHLALIKNDLPKLNYSANALQYFGDKIGKGYSTGAEAAHLGFKQMMQHGQLNDDDTNRLYDLNQQQKELANRNYDMNGFDKAAFGWLADWVVNPAQTAVRGFLEGIQQPGPSNTFFARGLLGSIGTWHAIGANYNQLSSATKPDGTPLKMDEETKRNIAIGTGLASTLPNLLVPEMAEAITPFIGGTLTPKFVQMAMQAPENAVMRTALFNIGKSTATFGTIGAMNAASQIMGEEMTKQYDGTHASFINSLVSASQKIATNRDGYFTKLAEGAGSAALSGGLLSTAGNIASIGSMRANVENIAQRGHEFVDYVNKNYDVSRMLPGEEGEPPAEGPRPPPKDVTPPRVGDQIPVEQSIKPAVDSLQFHEGLHSVNDVMNSTEMSKASPSERASILQKMFDHAGIGKLYTTLTNMRLFSQVSPEAAKKAANLVDPSGLVAGQMSAPIAVDPVKVMDVARENPEILDHVSPSPVTPQPLQAKAHIENWQNEIQKRQDLFAKLGIKPEDVRPDEPSNVENLPVNKKEVAPFDFESVAKRTSELLASNKELQQHIQDAEDARAAEKENGTLSIDSKGNEKSRDKFIKMKQDMIEENNKDLESLKSKVTAATKKEPPGKVLMGHWPEPGIDQSTGAMMDYLNGPTFPEAIKKALPKAKVKMIEEAQLKARENRVNDVLEAAKHEMDKVQDIHAAELREQRLQDAYEQIANDPNFAIAEKFRDNRKGKNSVFQIDPKSLSKAQVEFADRMKDSLKGVFVKKGGSDLEGVAQLLGAKNGDHLLSVLANTPTREQVAKARAAAYGVSDEMNLRAQDDLNHTKIIEEIRDQAKNHLEELKFLREQEWPGLKAGIKATALPLPKIEAIESKARDMVSKMKISELNPRQFEVGRSRSYRAAINSIMKNQFPAAGEHLEAAALNAAVRKEMMVQIGLVNRGMNFARKFTSKRFQQVLADAGTSYTGAAKEILDLWNLSPSMKKTAELGQFRKFVMQQLKLGRGDLTIPENLSDLRESATEMTVQQFQVVTDRLNMIYNLAKLKNKLQASYEQRLEEAQQDSLEFTEAKTVFNLEQHPGYSKNKIPDNNGNNTIIQNFHIRWGAVESMIAGKQNILRELDQGKLGGYFYELFGAPIEGSGKYYEKSGFTKLKKLNRGDEAAFDALAKAHGSFDKLERTFLDISEFHNTPELGRGQMTKADLMTAFANFGQAYSKDKLINNNGKLSEEIWQQVFDKHLTKADVNYVRGLFKIYEGKRGDIQKLQEARGREVTFIEGIPMKHQGEQFMGSYVPVKYKVDLTKEEAIKADEILSAKNASYFEKDDGAKYGRQWAAEATKQGYLTERSGSDKEVSLSFLRLHEGLAEINHDLSYGLAIERNMKLWRRPNITGAMKGVIGEAKTKQLIQSDLEIAGRPSVRDDGYYSDVNRTAKKWLNKLGRGFAVTALWGKSSVVLKQFESLGEMFNAMGPMGLPHFTKTLSQMVRSAGNYSGLIEVARQLDPSIEKYVNDTSDTAVQSVMKNMPRKGSSAIMDPVKNASAWLVDAGFQPVMQVDKNLKVAQALTVMNMALAGHHPDLPREVMDKMSDQEKFQKIQTLVQQMSTLTQIQNRSELQAPIQKYAWGKPWTFFWNYPRNILNNNLLDIRRTKWKAQEAFEDAKQGNAWESGKKFGTAAGIALQRMAWTFAVMSFTRWIHDKGRQHVRPLRDAEDYLQAGLESFGEMMMSPFEQMAEMTPIVKDAMYALSNKKKYQEAEVQNPETKAITDIATCLPAIRDRMFLSREMGYMQTMACLQAESYIGIPIPVGGALKLAKWIEDNTPSRIGPSHLQMDDLHAFQQDAKEFVNNPPPNVDPAYVDGIKKLHTQLAGETATVPKDAADSIKMAVSHGDWRSPDGLYGFSKDQWSQIQKDAPDLGLTDAGRTAKNTEQQEKAMHYQLENNAYELAQKDIPVNKSTLFGAHKLGLENYEKLFEAANDQKVKSVLPGLGEKFPDLGQFKTVGQIKQYLVHQIDQGKKAVSPTAQLTNGTSNPED